MQKQHLIAAIIVLVAFISVGAIFFLEPRDDTGDQSHSMDAATEDYERGPHNGRLLRSGDFAIEVTIFETGVPPEFRLYPYNKGEPIDPSSVGLTVELVRLGDGTDRFKFVPESEYLRGQGVVTEPHSFDVNVSATWSGQRYAWSYESHEGRTSIADSVAYASGIETEVAGSATIASIVSLTGRIQPDPARFANVRARFPGVVQEIRRTVGDVVNKGDVIAVVESNDSLRSYRVVAPIAGQIVRQNATIGELAEDVPLFEIADTSRVIAELALFPRNATSVEKGQIASISSIEGEYKAASAISVVLPIAQASTQSSPVHVYLDNASGIWKPGMLVTGDVVVSTREAPLAVRNAGLQAFRDFTVVYAKVGESYEVRMLELGESDGTHSEVLGGLKPGTTYVTENSFLIKADIEKSGATHDH